jgi:uncharacterized protein YndB with AHSA1/START domain
MPSAKRSITINRPIEDVFAYVAKGENGLKWRSGVLDLKHDSGEGVGATYRQRVKGPMGRRIAADYEVTAYEPPSHMAFKAIAGPVRPTGEYRLEKAGDGKTKVAFSLEAQLGFLKRLLMGRAVQKSMDAEMRALDKLKKVLEAASGARGAPKPAAKATVPAAKTSSPGTSRTPAKTAPKPTSRRSPTKRQAPPSKPG